MRPLVSFHSWQRPDLRGYTRPSMRTNMHENPEVTAPVGCFAAETDRPPRALYDGFRWRSFRLAWQQTEFPQGPESKQVRTPNQHARAALKALNQQEKMARRPSLLTNTPCEQCGSHHCTLSHPSDLPPNCQMAPS